MRKRLIRASALAAAQRRRAAVESLEVRQLFAVGGDLDPTFGGDGKVIASFNASQQSGSDVKIGPDESVYVVGHYNNRWGLAKIKPEIDKLGLGEPLMHDLYGVRLETKAEIDERQLRKKQQLDLEVSRRKQSVQR